MKPPNRFIMKSSTKIILFFFLWALLFPFSYDVSSAQDKNITLSSQARLLLEEPWQENSFEAGTEIMLDRQEETYSRRVVMEHLHHHRAEMTTAERMQLLKEVTSMAKDPSLEADFAAQAIHTMGNMTLTLEELGEISRAEATSEAGFLIRSATDPEQSHEVRMQAINFLGLLRIPGASGVLKSLLESEIYVETPEIARPAALSMARIKSEDAVPVLASVLQNTNDERIFGTAAYALGQIPTPESMSALVQVRKRFPDSSAPDAALVDMEEVILDILTQPQNDKLGDAIAATLHLWRTGQREKYFPALKGLLDTAPLSLRKEALDRLLDEAGKQKFEVEIAYLLQILELIEDQSELFEYTNYIKTRMEARRVSPAGTGIPVKIQQ